MAISNIPPGLAAYQNLSGMENKSNTALKNQSEQAEQTGIKADQITIRNERQASLVAHLFGDPNTAIQDSLKMTYQAAIGKLNDVLEADLGENAISEENLNAVGGMEYWSSENTASRIVNGATAFLSGFQKAHPELQGEALMEKYMDVVGGGLIQGFNEAQSILEDLNVFDGMVSDNFNATTSLVEQGMENFRRDYLGLPSLEEEATPTNEPKEQTDNTTLA